MFLHLQARGIVRLVPPITLDKALRLASPALCPVRPANMQGTFSVPGAGGPRSARTPLHTVRMQPMDEVRDRDPGLALGRADPPGPAFRDSWKETLLFGIAVLGTLFGMAALYERYQATSNRRPQVMDEETAYKLRQLLLAAHTVARRAEISAQQLRDIALYQEELATLAKVWTDAQLSEATQVPVAKLRRQLAEAFQVTTDLLRRQVAGETRSLPRLRGAVGLVSGVRATGHDLATRTATALPPLTKPLTAPTPVAATASFPVVRRAPADVGSTGTAAGPATRGAVTAPVELSGGMTPASAAPRTASAAPRTASAAPRTASAERAPSASRTDRA